MPLYQLDFTSRVGTVFKQVETMAYQINIITRLHLQGKVARRAIVFNNLVQIMQSCTNPAICQIRNRHMRHVLNAHEHQFDKTPPNRAR